MSDATAHGRSWEPCGFRKQRALRVPSVSFWSQQRVGGYFGERQAERNNKTKKGEEKESYFVCVASFSFFFLLSFQAMNSREKEEKEGEEGLLRRRNEVKRGSET